MNRIDEADSAWMWCHSAQGHHIALLPSLGEQSSSRALEPSTASLFAEFADLSLKLLFTSEIFSITFSHFSLLPYILQDCMSPILLPFVRALNSTVSTFSACQPAAWRLRLTMTMTMQVWRRHLVSGLDSLTTSQWMWPACLLFLWPDICFHRLQLSALIVLNSPTYGESLALQ